MYGVSGRGEVGSGSDDNRCSVVVVAVDVLVDAPCCRLGLCCFGSRVFQGSECQQKGNVIAARLRVSVWEAGNSCTEGIA